jgi:hypothetical protein
MTEHLEVAHKVAGDEADENEARDRHEEFAADGRAKEIAGEAHRKVVQGGNPPRGRGGRREDDARDVTNGEAKV